MKHSATIRREPSGCLQSPKTRTQCWLVAALALLLVLGGAVAQVQTPYAAISYGHFPLTPIPPPPAYVFPEDSQGWQVMGFLGRPAVTYDFLIAGQPAYTFSSLVGAGVDPSPWCPSNAVTAIPVGAFGDGLAFPVWYGQLIGPEAAGVSWIAGAALTDNRDLGPGFSTSTGLFTGLESAYLGLRFYLNGQTHYGWVRIGVPYAGLNGVWLYDYAYSTAPYTPIVAGMGVPDPAHMSQFIASFRAANEVPAGTSTHSGSGQFTLSGNMLTYDLELDVTFAPTGGGIFGPASPGSVAERRTADLGSYTVHPPPSPLSNEPFVFGSVSYTGSVALTDRQIDALRTGLFYVNFTSASLPRGELRGQILPLAPAQFAADMTRPGKPHRHMSPFHGTAAFTLVGNELAYGLAVDTNTVLSFAGVFGPAHGPGGPHRLICALDTSLGVLAPRSGLPGQILYSGTVTLTDREVEQLKRGEFYVSLAAASFPHDELRGQVLPLDSDRNGLPDYDEVYLAQTCPCAGPWTSHAQYVSKVSLVAGRLAASGLITPRQYRQILREAQLSNCGRAR